MFSRSCLTVLCVAAITACSDSTGPSNLSLAQLAGTWDLSRLDMLLASDTTVREDVKATYGIAITLSINSDGSASMRAEANGQPAQTIPATIAIHGDTIVWEASGSGGPYEATVKLAGRTMSWLAVETDLWDIDNDGSPEDVFERDVWQRH